MRRPRTVDRRAWVVTALFVLVSTWWALAVPLFHPPDEQMHVDLISSLAHDPSYPGYDQQRVDPVIWDLSVRYLRAGDGSRHPHLGNRREPEPTAAARVTPESAGAGVQGNQMPQHPPLYYEAMAGSLRLERAIHGRAPLLAREVLLLRLLNVGVVSALPLLTWLIARELGASPGASIAAATLLVAVPQLTHLVGSVNNDNLLTILGAWLTLLAVRVARRAPSARRAVAIGGVLGAMLLTKAFAFLFVPCVLLAFAVAARRSRRWMPHVVHAAASLIVASLLSAWFWVDNLVRYGQLAPTTFFERAAVRPPGSVVDHAGWFQFFAIALPVRFWGAIGRYAARLPVGVAVGATIVLVVLVVAALVRSRPAPSPVDRPALVLALLPVGLLAVYVGEHAHHIYAVTGWTAFIQGRYLFAGLGGLAGVVAVGADRLARRRVDPRWALAFATALQVLAIERLLRVVWGGSGVGLVGALTTMAVWSPASGPVVLGVSIAVAATGAAAFLWLAPARGVDAL